MKTTRIITIAVLLSSFAASGASAWDQDPFAMYVQRSWSITLGAGDAKAVNAATHVIDPWPPYVGERRATVTRGYSLQTRILPATSAAALFALRRPHRDHRWWRSGWRSGWRWGRRRWRDRWRRRRRILGAAGDAVRRDASTEKLRRVAPLPPRKLRFFMSHV